jgi:hypothetical protein
MKAHGALIISTREKKSFADALIQDCKKKRAKTQGMGRAMSPWLF